MPGSLLDEMIKLTHWLTRIFPWHENQAALFLLTGDAPQTLPLKGKIDQYFQHQGIFSTITLTVEPWVSYKSVVSFYRQIQKWILGRENRPLREQSLQLFRFVTVQQTTAGKKPTWSEMLERWNEDFAEEEEWTYGPDGVRNFNRDYHRIKKLMLNQSLEHSETKVSPVPFEFHFESWE